MTPRTRAARAAVALIALFAASSLPASVRAVTVIHVPADHATIQAAINAAAPGDTVLVEAGTYHERLTIDKAITLESAAGAETTIIDGDAGGTVVDLSNSPVLRGFTVRNGGGISGHGVHVFGSALIEQNRIVDNVACGDGAGIEAQSSDATIQDNLISGNATNACSGGVGGGGIALLGIGSATISRNVIRDNHAGLSTGPGGIYVGGNAASVSGNLITDNAGSAGGGLEVDTAAAVITNNLVAGNSATSGGGVAVRASTGGATPSVTNNTIVGNTATDGTAFHASDFYAPTLVRNNVFSGSTTGPLVSCSSVSSVSPPVLESNDAWNTVGPTYAGTCAGTTGTAGNVSVDPMFVDAAHDDYHLRADSVLIDAGTNTGAPADDRDGDARPFDGDEDGTATTDIGFDEAVDPVLVAPVSLYVGNVDVTASGLGSVTIGNFGSAPMTVDSLSVAGPNATEYSVHQEDCTQVPIAIGDTCTVSIAFAPIDLGTRTASLTISGPDPMGDRIVALEGVGIDPILVLPPSVDFGDTLVTVASPPQTVTLNNYGGAPATVNSVAIAGTNASDFAVLDDACTGSPVPGSGGSCDLHVAFTPSALGGRTATLEITGSGMIGTRQVTLAGNGTPKPSGIAWGTTYAAGPAYTWNSGGAFAQTVQAGTQRLHLAYATDRVGGAWSTNTSHQAGVYYTRASSGSTWTTGKRLNPSTQTAIRLGLAAYGSRVYATWVSQTRLTSYSPTAPRVLYVRVNTNYGSSTSWGSTIRLSSSTGRVDYPSIAVSGYDVYVAYTDSVSGAVKLAISHDRGVHWSTASVGTTTLANSSGRIALPVVAASGSNVVVSWIAGSSGALRTRVSTDRAAHWNPTATPAASSTGYFHVAVRGTRIALAWTTSTDLVLRQRINGTWTTPATLSTPDAGETGPYAPAVAIQAANRIAVSWTEELDNGYGDLRWIESPDGGATWFKAESIYRGTSSTVRRINDYVSIAWPTEGSRYLVWNGWTPNTNSYRLYLRRGTGTPVGPLSAASEWRPSTAVQRASVDGVQPRWGAAEGR